MPCSSIFLIFLQYKEGCHFYKNILQISEKKSVNLQICLFYFTVHLWSVNWLKTSDKVHWNGILIWTRDIYIMFKFIIKADILFIIFVWKLNCNNIFNANKCLTASFLQDLHQLFYQFPPISFHFHSTRRFLHKHIFRKYKRKCLEKIESRKCSKESEKRFKRV